MVDKQVIQTQISDHAQQRTQERARGLTPQQVLEQVSVARINEAEPFAITVTGLQVYPLTLNGLPVAYALVTEDTIKTVLAVGMDVNLPSGRAQLPGPAAGTYQIPVEQYHADPCTTPALSSTLAKLILDRSPLHAWTASPLLNPAWKPTIKAHFDVGTAAHRAVLGAGGNWAVYPADLLGKGGAVSTNAAKEWAAAQREAGRTPIKAEVEEQVLDMAEAVTTMMARAGVTLEPGRSEMTALAEIDGIWCRALFDNAPANKREPLWDLKTTTDASPGAVERAVMNYGYDVQAAHYADVWKAATGEDRKFRFVFIEKDPPYGVTVVALSEEVMDHARRKIARARLHWRECLLSGEWPSYPLAQVTISLPEWFHTRGLERETANEDWRAAAGNKPSAAALANSYRLQAPAQEKTT